MSKTVVRKNESLDDFVASNYCLKPELYKRLANVSFMNRVRRTEAAQRSSQPCVSYDYVSWSFFINQKTKIQEWRPMSLKETINNDIKTAMKAKIKKR